MRTATVLCVRAHDEPVAAADGIYLCAGCRNGMESRLADIPGLYADLGDILDIRGHGAGGGARPSSAAGRPLPIRPDVAEHRHQIVHDLAWWGSRVASLRGLRVIVSVQPDVTGPWLLRHVDWIAARPDMAEVFPGVMADIVGRARGLLAPSDAVRLGTRCLTIQPDGDQCPGTITVVHDPGHLLPETSWAWTARCPHCGPQDPEPYVAGNLDGRWVTAVRVVTYALAVHRRSIQTATVRQWAHRGHITATEVAGKGWYDLGSVHKYLSSRTPETLGPTMPT